MIARRLPLRLRLVCANPPPALIEGKPVLFGLQGGRDELLPGQPGPDGGLVFTCELQVTLFNDDRVHRELRGAVVHGRRDEPFLYLSLRFAEADGDLWLRRWKVLFARLSDDLIRQADGSVIEATVDLRHGNSPPRAPLTHDWDLSRSAG